jgi:hypothetical protein
LAVNGIKASPLLSAEYPFGVPLSKMLAGTGVLFYFSVILI